MRWFENEDNIRALVRLLIILECSGIAFIFGYLLGQQ